MKYVLFSIFIIAAIMALPFVLAPVPEEAPIDAIVTVALRSVPTSFFVLLVGCLGLLFRPNRFAGFVAVTLATLAVMAYLVNR